MPPTQLKSPGVAANEVDKSFIEQGAAQPGAVLIGRTPAGPAFYPTTVSNFDQFSAIFGGIDPTMAVTYAAKTYLANSNSLTVVRVLGSADGTSATNGYTVGVIVGITDTSGTISTTGSILAEVHCSGPFAAVQVSGVAGDANNFVFKVGSLFAATASFLTSSDNYIAKVLNTDPTKYSTYGHYLASTYPFQKQAASASWYPVETSPAAYTNFLRDMTFGSTSWIKSQLIGGIEFDLFRFDTLGHGRATNDRIKVQIANVRPSSAPAAYPYGTFDVLVRSFYDTDARPVVLERYAGCNLDPVSPNYLPKVIGDIREEFSTTNRKFEVIAGSYPNKSKYVRVEMNTTQNFPPAAVPWGFRGYPKLLFSGSNAGDGGSFGIASVPGLPYTPSQFDANGNYASSICWGVSFVSGGIADRMRALPDGAINGFQTGTDADFSLSHLSGGYANGQLRYWYVSSWNSYAPLYYSGTLHQFTLPFAGGFDGWDLRVQDPTYLQYTDIDSNIGVVSLRRAVDTVSDPDQITGDVLSMPGINNQFVTDYTRTMVNARKDMLYVMDLTGSTPDEIVATLSARQIDDNYTAAYYPDLKYTDPSTGNVVRVPPSVGVLGALAYTDRVAQAFFAPAGLNRGGLAQFNITDTVDRLRQQDRDKLYDNRVNPITKFPGEGIVVWGQKTLQLLPSALDRVNVRRLLILAKRAIRGIALALVFEPSDPASWTRFKNAVNPILDTYRRDQGINRFRVIMDSTTNTPDVIDRNEMYGKIFLEPVKAGEYITVDFVITPAGVTFGS